MAKLDVSVEILGEALQLLALANCAVIGSEKNRNSTVTLLIEGELYR